MNTERMDRSVLFTYLTLEGNPVNWIQAGFLTYDRSFSLPRTYSESQWHQDEESKSVDHSCGAVTVLHRIPFYP